MLLLHLLLNGSHIEMVVLLHLQMLLHEVLVMHLQVAAIVVDGGGNDAGRWSQAGGGIVCVDFRMGVGWEGRGSLQLRLGHRCFV